MSGGAETAPGGTGVVTGGAETASSGTGVVTGEWRPALAPAIILRHDPVRGADLLVMPERIVLLKGEAAAVLRLCDGARTVAEIVGELRDGFPGAPVADDVAEFLGQVRAEGWVR
ncbi:pyrroloquinoline quinone biosynthesis peptide chaperone PqqD [Streptosporangium sp. NPDC051023]|uniref:pyrroloquinoline quinone biosynthesis peptide chaperone PqqD n=1 Tax=Streptosporangium sp. NPDC051023 TaxID=3155410 RepID=UPI0034501E9C